MIYIILLCAFLIAFLLLLVYFSRGNKHMEKFVEYINTPPELKCFINSNKSEEGLEYFSNKRVLICGMVRDSANTIKFIRHKAELLGSLFADYSVLIVENDSVDNTRELLLDWSRENKRVKVLGCGLNVDKCTLVLDPTIIHDRSVRRIQKMVKLRNVYMDYINENSDLKNFDFIVIWDFDLLGTFYVDGIGHSGYYFKYGMKNSKDEITAVNAMCANAIAEIDASSDNPVEEAMYYDPYAHQELGDSSDINYHNDRKRNDALRPDDCKQPRQVKSCFNGFTIYRAGPFLKLRYKLEVANKEAVCEHVTLHAKMDGVFINPSMVFAIEHKPELWYDAFQ